MNLVKTDNTSNQRSIYKVLNLYIAFDDGMVASYTLDYWNQSFDLKLRGTLALTDSIISIELVEPLVIINTGTNLLVAARGSLERLRLVKLGEL